MKTSAYVRRSIEMLGAKHRRRFILMLILQIAPGFFDLVGVALLGLLTAEAQNLLTRSLAHTWYLPSNFFQVSSATTISVLLFLVFLCFVIRSLVAPYLQRRLLRYLGNRANQITLELQSRYFIQDVLFIQRRTSQETTFLFNSAVFQTVADILGNFSLIISETSLLILLVSALFIVNPLLTFFVIAFFSSIIFLLNSLSRNFTRRENQKFNESKVAADKLIQETINSYREIYAAQKFSYFAKSSIDNLNLAAFSRANLTWVNLIPKYILDAALVAGIALIGLFSWFTESHREAVSTSLIFLVVASRLMPSLLRINTGLQGVNNNSDASDRVYALISDLETVEKLAGPFTGGTSIQDSRSLISVKDLEFKYPDSDKTIFSNLNLEIISGEFIAIVGPSGVGKSTLVDLLLGVVQDPSKSILVNGIDPRHLVNANPGFISYVPQRVNLMNRTLRENIAIGCFLGEISESSLNRAIELSSLSEFTSKLPNGLDTLVGENGFNLSGGQIQRIGLARALYSNPEILILDEATSALDAETEHAISESLAALSGEITLIVVAHRLATVRKASKILYLGEDNFFTLGTFEELRREVPSFDRQAQLLGL